MATADGRIFISYRRQETAWPARQLYQALCERYGVSQVFKDVDNIAPGEDFVERVSSTVASCQVMLAMLGPRWAVITDEDGNRRIDDPNDFVRLEVATALSRGVLVVPILVDGARMPKATELPEELVGITRRQAVEISPTGFNLDRLFLAVDDALSQSAAAAGDDAVAASPASDPLLTGQADPVATAGAGPEVVAEPGTAAVAEPEPAATDQSGSQAVPGPEVPGPDPGTPGPLEVPAPQPEPVAPLAPEVVPPTEPEVPAPGPAELPEPRREPPEPERQPPEPPGRPPESPTPPEQPTQPQPVREPPGPSAEPSRPTRVPPEPESGASRPEPASAAQPSGPTPAAPQRRSRLPLVIGIAAAVVLIGGAGLATMLVPGSGTGASPPQPGPGPINASFVVDNQGSHTDQPISCTAGRVLAIEASGELTDADGVTGGPDGAAGWFDADAPMAQVPRGALIAITEGTDPVFVGDTRTLVCPADGILAFSLNSLTPADYDGELKVTVTARDDLAEDSLGLVELTLPGNRAWLRTDYDCVAGEQFRVSAIGMTSADGAAPAAAGGADGVRPKDGQMVPGAAANQYPHRALLARVNGGRPFLLGSSATLDCPADGPVEVQVNDGVLEDNTGELTVTLSRWSP